MATAVESSNPTRKPKKGGKGPGQNSAVRLKTVVRKLPPNLPEDIFWQSVAPWVDDNTCTWKTFHTGKLKGVCVPDFVVATPTTDFLRIEHDTADVSLL